MKFKGRKQLVLGAAVLALAVPVAACGSDNSDKGDSSSSSSSKDKGSVAVLLPDSKSSTRWETVDRPFLKKAFDAAGVKSTITNAEGDKSAQQQQAEQAITNGAKVLLLVNLDSGSGAAIAANAKSQGVKVIDYDRLTLKGDSDYYVSFDNEKVGKLQGQGLVDCLGKTNGQSIATLNGSPTDNNATLFAKGYNSVVDPLYKDGKLKKAADQSVPDWDNQKALTIFEQMLQKTSNKIDGVLAANDGLGNAAISALKQRKLKQIPVTGQDATLEGIQNILNGDQCMTVYKAIKKETDASAALAIQLLKGETPSDVDGEGQQREQGRPLDPARAGRGDEGQHQGLHRGGRLPEEGGHLRRQGRREVHGGGPVMTDETGGRREAPSTSPILELRGVSKSFGAVQALFEVDFHVAAGEVMALVGDNGAGKSTLIKCIAGIHPIDSGDVIFEGSPVNIHGPKDAAALGIEVVYQDLALADNLDVVQNMYLGREELGTLRRLDETAMEKRASETLKGLSVTTIRSVRQTVAGLSGGQRQSVAVAKAVMWNSRVVILDEPTAALGVAQTKQVLDLVARLGEQGLAVVLISHNLHDIFQVADSITVLRLGQNVKEFKRRETNQQEVVEAITAGQLSKVPGQSEEAVA